MGAVGAAVTMVKPSGNQKNYLPPQKKTKHVSQMMKRALGIVSSFRSVDDFNDDDYMDAIQNSGRGSMLSKGRREELKNLSRWETNQNTWLKGISKTKRNDIVGTGPRIQICDSRFENEEQFEIARQFNQWMVDVRFAKSLRLMVGTEHDEGESFGFVFQASDEAIRSTPWNYRNPLNLHFRVMDTDRFTEVDFAEVEPNSNDGIRYDQFGKPITYRVLRSHPTDVDFSFSEEEVTPISSEHVFHFYQEERPEQCRGIPEGASGLGAASKIRNYCSAVIQAMVNASTIGGYLTTELDPIAEVVLDEDGIPEQDENGDIKTEVDCPEDGESFTANPDMVQCLPRGYDYKQHDTPSVVSDHGDFTNSVITQVGAASCMPRHKSTKDSSNYNYSSVRADGQDWQTCVKIYRSCMEWDLTRLFIIWWNLAIENRDVLSEDLATIISTDSDLPSYPRHVWQWDGMPHVDPSKESRANKEQLSYGGKNLYDIHAEQGKNWDEVLPKSAAALGISEEEYLECLKTQIFPNMVPLLQTRSREDAQIQAQILKNRELEMKLELKKLEMASESRIITS